MSPAVQPRLSPDRERCEWLPGRLTRLLVDGLGSGVPSHQPPLPARAREHGPPGKQQESGKLADRCQRLSKIVVVAPPTLGRCENNLDGPTPPVIKTRQQW
jgi:hypothetical protein